MEMKDTRGNERGRGSAFAARLYDESSAAIMQINETAW